MDKIDIANVIDIYGTKLMYYSGFRDQAIALQKLDKRFTQSVDIDDVVGVEARAVTNKKQEIHSILSETFTFKEGRYDPDSIDVLYCRSINIHMDHLDSRRAFTALFCVDVKGCMGYVEKSGKGFDAHQRNLSTGDLVVFCHENPHDFVSDNSKKQNRFLAITFSGKKTQ